jgi:Domain of unknown function (DUF1937)
MKPEEIPEPDTVGPMTTDPKAREPGWYWVLYDDVADDPEPADFSSQGWRYFGDDKRYSEPYKVVADCVLPPDAPPTKIIYLACPYTHPNPGVRAERFRLATEAAAKLIRQGHIVYSPITMSHPLDLVLAGDTNTLGSDYWVQYDKAFMAVCAEMIILEIDGWDQSSGIRREIEYFRSHGKPISWLKQKESRTISRAGSPSL